MKKLGVMICVVFGCASALAPVDASAQRYKYMDNSGNIHFVDSFKQVPREFREQVVPPTPTPVLDEKGRKQLQRYREREAREAQRKAEARKREIEKNLKAAQKQNRLAAGRGDAAPVEQSKTREDRIEMIK
jgi:hypothetical protein